MLSLSMGVRGAGLLFMILWARLTFGVGFGADAAAYASVETAEGELVSLPDEIYNDIAAETVGAGPLDRLFLYTYAGIASDFAQTVVTAATVGMEFGWQYRSLIQPIHVKVLAYTGVLLGGGVTVYRELQKAWPRVRRAV
jgi:hypothetical protein